MRSCDESGFTFHVLRFTIPLLAFPIGMAEENSWLQKFQKLLDDRGWRSERELTRTHRFVHFWVLLGKSFVRNRCPVRASALSYTDRKSTRLNSSHGYI